MVSFKKRKIFLDFLKDNFNFGFAFPKKQLLPYNIQRICVQCPTIFHEEIGYFRSCKGHTTLESLEGLTMTVDF